MFVRPPFPAGLDRAVVDASCTQRVGQQPQGGHGIAFQEHVRLRGMVNHVQTKRRFIDGNDHRLFRAIAGRIPGGAAPDRYDQVGIVEKRLLPEALMQRMIHGKV